MQGGREACVQGGKGGVGERVWGCGGAVAAEAGAAGVVL